MFDWQPTLFRDTRAILVESLYYEPDGDEMVWVDITAGTVHRSPLGGAVDGSDDTVLRLAPPVSAVQPRDGGGYVVAGRSEILLLDPDGAVERTLATVAHRHDGMRLNEGKCDPAGRFLVGSMDLTTGDPDGAVYRVDARGGLVTVLGGFGVANGFEWTDDGGTAFVTDTAASTVYSAEEAAGGLLRDPEPFLVGLPSDGLTRDSAGRFWNGLYGEGGVALWDTDGALLERFALPVPNVTSVAFGGADLGSLFVGSARENLTEEQLVASPASGGIFRVDGLATGLPVKTFGG